jgi:hypothetical protein
VDQLEGEFVAVAMTDTGVGIAVDVLPKIFEPFFTTKGLGKGTPGSDWRRSMVLPNNQEEPSLRRARLAAAPPSRSGAAPAGFSLGNGG